MGLMNSKRIVLLGNYGVGKSSLANMIFEEDDVFKINDSAVPETKKCKSETRLVNGGSITLIDTPGFFDTDRSEEELKPAIVRCMTECAPGPHAFLILLKVENYTEQEEAVIKKITECFSEEAFKYAAVVFTHGDQLPNGMKIQEYIRKNKGLKDLVKKCGGRCHVVDNKYWNKDQEKEYKRSRFQVAEILNNTVDKMVKENNGDYYTNEMLQIVEEEIQQKEKSVRQSSGNMSDQEIRETAKKSVFEKLLIRFVGSATGALLGALCGVVVMCGAVATALTGSSKPLSLQQATAMTVKTGIPAAVGAVAGVTAGAAVAGAVVAGTAVAGTAVGIPAVFGAVKGGMLGYSAAKEAESPGEAIKNAAAAVKEEAQRCLDKTAEKFDKLL